MPRRQRSDSLFTAIQEAREATESDVEPPEGVALETEDQVTIWRHYSRARRPEDWRSCDLLALARLVDLEVDIRRQRRALAVEDDIVNGKPNPRFGLLDSLQRQQLAVVRSLALNHGTTGGSATSTINKAGSRLEAAKRDREGKSKSLGAHSLLAGN